MSTILRKSIRQILLTGSASVLAAGVIGIASAAVGVQNPPPGPGFIPDYFGITGNYANSPQPRLADVDPVSMRGAVAGPGTGAAATTYDYAQGLQRTYVVDVQGGSGYALGDVLTINGNGTTTCDVTVTNVDANGKIVPVVDTAGNVTAPGVDATQLAACTGFATPIANTGIRKFVDSLATLSTTPNNLGHTLPVADKTATPGHSAPSTDNSDYYVIAEVAYAHKMHTDLEPTHLRGYVQVWPNGTPGKFTLAGFNANATDDEKLAYASLHANYLGPIIVAEKDKPVRVKLVNLLPTGAAGDLPFAVDHTYMGAEALNAGGAVTNNTDNRTAMHLHGGTTPWISDGLPRQWIKPAGEAGAPRGETARDVPDMWFNATGDLISSCTGQTSCAIAGATNSPGAGALSFYYTNEQSARLMFYHDHAEGITRLNVYDGLAGGYVLTDPTEQGLIETTPQQELAGVTPRAVADGFIPLEQIPLIIQEKTFVPDNSKPVLNFYGPFASQLQSQDPTWRWGSGAAVPVGSANGNGDLWVPHVFMPNQNPGDISGANAVGRWDYGPWFWPPFIGIQHGAIANPYYDPACTSANPDPLTGACEGQFIPGTPTGAINVGTLSAEMQEPSGQPEAFNDTMTVNGTVYPYMNVSPKKYRLRILSVGNDRHLNLSLFVASSKNSTTTQEANRRAPGPDVVASATALANTCDGTNAVSANPAECTEVRMLPWDQAQNGTLTQTANGLGTFPQHWYSYQKTGVIFDGRPSGVPDPAVRGPAMIQIGTEGGFLSNPVVIKNQPVNYEYNVKNIVVTNVKEHALLLGPAERADVVVDFSKFAGSTLIMYNDAPAALPAGDLRLDYYTGDWDNTDTGGAFSTQPGYGPNTRTIMQFRVAACNGATGCDSSHPVDYVDQAYLGDSTTGLTSKVQNAFKTSQEPVIVPQAAHNAAYGVNVADATGQNLSTISGSSFTYNPLVQDVSGNYSVSPDPVTIDFQPKTIIEDWTLDYGRMNAMLGVEMPHTTAINQTAMPFGYVDPATELVKISNDSTQIGTLADGTQIWKITHNGVDTHPIHFHLFHVQLINRVGWDGAISTPQENELGWKDIVRMNPLEDVIVALRPKQLHLPFKLGNSKRTMDPGNPNAAMTTTMAFNLDPTTGNASNVTNVKGNFGWEYVWHCHILGHEENDMMRPIAVAHKPEDPNVNTVSVSANNVVTINWTDNSMVAQWAEIQEATDSAFADIVKTTVVMPNLVAGKAEECASQAGCPRTSTYTPTASNSYIRIRTNNTVGMGAGIQDKGYNLNGSYISTLASQLSTAQLGQLMPNFTGYANVTASSEWVNANAGNPVVLPLSPSALNFGNVQVNTAAAPNSLTKTVTVTNTLATDMTVTSVQVCNNNAINATTGIVSATCTTTATGPSTNYTVVNNCGATPLAAGGACTIDVKLTPSATGARNAFLKVTTTPAGGVASRGQVALTGTGVAAAGTLTTPIAFGNVQNGVASAAMPVVLTNTGIGPLSFNAPTFNANASNYSYTTAPGTCVSPLPVNTSCTFNVVVTPSALGNRGTTMGVVTGAGNKSATITATSRNGAVFTAATVGALSFNTANTRLLTINGLTGPQLSTVTVTNNTSANLALGTAAVVTTTTGQTNWNKGADSCSSTSLAPGNSCKIEVSFNAPAGNSTRAGTLTLPLNGVNTTMSLTGN